MQSMAITFCLVCVPVQLLINKNKFAKYYINSQNNENDERLSDIRSSSFELQQTHDQVAGDNDSDFTRPYDL